MKLFLGIALCGLLPGFAIARGGMGGGFHGGASGGFRGGSGSFHGRFGGFGNQPGRLGIGQAFGFAYGGGVSPDYGSAEAQSESYPAPEYISVTGPYIGIGTPYIGDAGAVDEPYDPAQFGFGYPPFDPGQQAGPYQTLPPYPARRLTFERPDRTLNVVAPPSIDESESRELVWIALKDHFVDTALTYWVQEKDLLYIKTDGSQHRIPLDLVDRQTSARLNARGPGKLILP